MYCTCTGWLQSKYKTQWTASVKWICLTLSCCPSFLRGTITTNWTSCKMEHHHILQFPFMSEKGVEQYCNSMWDLKFSQWLFLNFQSYKKIWYFLHDPQRKWAFLSVSSAVISLFRQVPISHEKHLLALSCLSVHTHHHSAHWTDFCEIWYWGLLRKSVTISQIWFKSDKNIAHFTWKPKCVSLLPVTNSP